MPTFKQTWCALALSFLFAVPVHATPPAWSLNQPIYEINPEMYAATGSFKAIEKDLPRLKALGVGILWITPIHPRGQGAYNSPYCISDHRGIYAPFGSSDDFKALVKAVHAQGLHIIMDWVGNHSSWDNPLIKSHPEYYVQDAQGRPQAVKRYTDIVQFDYRKPEVRQWATDTLVYWVKNYDVDGFRCDMAWNIPVDYWMTARKRLERIKPVFLLAEGNSADEAGAFDANYDWNLVPPDKSAEIIRIAKGQLTASVIDDALAKEAAYPRPPSFFRLRYTSNHDHWNDVGSPDELYGQGSRAWAVLMATLPGKPLLYNGQDIGGENRYRGPRTAWNLPPDPVIDWSDNTRSAWFGGFYRRLLHLYQEDPASNEGSFHKLASDSDCRTYAYLRQAGDDKVLVILNLSSQASLFQLHDSAIAGNYQDLFSGASAALTADLSGTARPWDYKVYVAGPHAEALMKGFAAQALASPWDGPEPLYSALACPTPTTYPAPGPVIPSETLCNDGDLTPITRLASGANSDAVTAAFSSRWDPQALHLHVDITDPSLHGESGSAWDNDAVELYLSTKNSHSASYQAGDFQYIFAYGRTEVFEGSQRVKGVAYTAQARPGGWVMDASIPWATLNTVPKDGLKLGFDVGIDFNQDGSGREGQLMWHGTADNYKDTRDFSVLILKHCFSTHKE
jgi:cyclomaltodextrinase